MSIVSTSTNGMPGDPLPAADSRAEGSIASILAACGHLFALTVQRQFLSRQTLISVALAVLCGLTVLAGGRHSEPSPKKLAERVLVPTYISFLMPILAICYGASAVGGEREDRTLIYLLITPIPRPLIYLTKWGATVGLVTVGAGVALGVLCALAGEIGKPVLEVFLKGSLLGAAAYGTLFLLLGAVFRHGTVIALAYWFFLEVLFANMPGIIKRVSVAFYVRCMIYDAGSELELGPVHKTAREMFLPISGEAASLTLWCAIVSLVTIGLIVFSRREYRDLS